MPEDNTLAGDIRKIAQEEAQKNKTEVVFPSEMDVNVKNWPEEKERSEVEKVEVTNWPEQKEPVFNVPAPVVNVETKEIVVEKADLTELAEMMSRQAELLNRIAEKESPEMDYEKLDQLLAKNKSIFTGHGGVSSKRTILDTKGKAIDPLGRDKIVDTSTAAALNNGENYTTGWFLTDGFTGIKVAFKTDQNGYYQVQYSPDGTNADSTLTRYYRTAQIEPPHKFENMRRYVKVTFYNDSGSNQTYFRPDIALTNSSGILNIPVDATMSQDYDAISTRPTDFNSEVALGRRQGWSTWNKFGYNADVDTTTDPEIVASWGGAFAYITTGETLNIVSTSTADDGDPAGTGARQIIIYGVDQDWNPQIEVVTMNGTTTVTTTSQWIGINRIAIYAAGSGKTNAGTINVTGTSTSTQLAQMPVGQGTSQQLIFYVPANHQFLATWLVLNALKEGPSSAPIVTFKGWVYSDVAGAEYEIFRGSEDTNATTDLILSPAEPFVVGEKSILWFTAETTQNDTTVRGRFSGKLVRDVDA